MAKTQTKLPTVFLACPFNKEMKTLLKELNLLPWTIRAANDKITTDHLLAKITADLHKCDFAIFDISGWNPNVCLELGLAKGLGKEYYIINNNSKKKDAPSDIKGIERIDYNWNKKKNAASLFEQIKNGIFKKRFITKKLWNNIQHSSYADKKFTLILYSLASLRGSKKKLTAVEIRNLAKGLNLKKNSDFTDVMNCFVDCGLFKKVQKSGAIALKKTLYK